MSQRRRSAAPPIRQGVFIDVVRLAAHPEWIQLSWEARGMALALMGMPLDETFRGTLPAETDAWRNALGLPSAQTMAAVRDRAIGLRGSRPSQEIEHAWTCWLNELKRWFRPIDDTFLKTHPQWRDCENRWWHPLLEEESGSVSVATTLIASKTPAKKSTPAPTPGKPRKTTKIHDDTLDYPPIRLSAGVVKQSWDPPVDSNTRVQLWEAGIQALGGEEKKARSLLGGLIKKYGEGPVAEAVAKLAVRAVRPADPAAFLRKQASIQAGEKPGVSAAASQRASVVL